MLCCSSEMKSRFDNWADIRVFLAVVRRGSTLAASRDLAMAQPTVARRIDALEHVLGLTLFDRDTRGFRPTKAALRLLPAAEGIEAAVTAFEADVDKAHRSQMRPIRVTAPRVNFSHNFSAILSDFKANNPGTNFELISSYKYLDLIAGEADVAVRFARKIDDDRLICRKMTTVRSALYASQSYADRHGLPASEAAFAGHSFVISDPSPKAMVINDWLRDRIDEEQIVSRCNGVDTIIAAIKAGLGIGPLNTSLAREDGTLIQCFPPPEGTEIYSWLVISPEAYRRPEVKAFSTFFVPRFRAIFKVAGQP